MAAPPAAIRASAPAPALLELVHLSNKLVLDSVYLNGLHALRRFELRNVSQFHLTVKLRSNLGAQIAFQLTNENLPERDSRPSSRNHFHRDLSSASLSSSIESGLSEFEGEYSQGQGPRWAPFPSNPGSPEPETPAPMASTSHPITTNTVAAAAIGTFGTEVTEHGHQFNQLFNYVNHIDELKIAPGQSQKVILAFLPDSPGRGRRNASEKDEPGPDRETKLEHISSDDETHDFFEVNGMLFFFAYKTSDTSSAADGQVLGEPHLVQESPVSTGEPDVAKSGGSSNLGWKSRSGATTTKESEDVVSPTTQSAPDHQITVKFRSRVCRSVLWTDIGDTGISFEDCVVGGTYFKDFTVWNRSEIELYWTLNMVDLSKKQDSSWLKLSDYDTGVPLDGKPIAAYSPRRIRLTFRPREMGDFNYDLQLENANDSGNTVETTIHAVVRSALREESLVVSSGNVLDFGDCYTGAWAKQRLVLRNVSESPIEITFTADLPGVVFQLKSEELTHGALPILAPTVTDAGDILFDKLHELSFTRSNNHSDTSYPTSATSSRPPSPTFKYRQAGEPFNMSAPSNDLASLIAAAAIAGADSNEDNDSDDSDQAETAREGVGSNGEEYRRIEEIVLKPGTERIVEVCYRPEKDAATLDNRGGRLTRRNFRLFLSYANSGNAAKERKTIQCKARTCTSFIEVAPKVVNFGDTDVGTLKSAPIQITNCSDLPARVELRFVSKVLNTYRDEIVIPPKQSIEAKVDIYPRKVNPEYRKQVTVVNLLNRLSDQTVEVRSTNIDKNRVTFHSLFYRILTPTSSNFVDFGSVVVNSAVARTLTIANISKKRLILEIASSLPDEIKLYARGQPAAKVVNTAKPQTASTVERRERLLESISDRRKLPRPDTSNGSLAAAPAAIKAGPPAPKLRAFGEPLPTSPADYLDLASSLGDKDGRRSPRRRTIQHHYPVNTLKQLRAQYRDVKMASVDDDLAGSSRLAPPVRRPQLDDSASDTSAKGVGDLDAEQLTKSLDLALRKVTEATNGSASALTDVPDSAKLPLNTLLNMLESVTGISPPPLSKLSVEEQYVRARLHLNRELEIAIKDGRLIPISLIEIAPDCDLPILLVFTPNGEHKPHVLGKARKMDSRVYLKLIEFDKEIQQPQFEQLLQGDQAMIPVRELLLRSSLCRSIMELNQKNINFGSMDRTEHRTKSIVIRNNSEAPLLYAIRKSGSIASGDLILGEGRMGVVRGYGKREVEFMFDPSLAGPFHERLSIENVQDRSNDQSISVKATIKKPPPFAIECQSVDFGPCLLGETSPAVQHVVISNTSFKKTRTFELRVDPDELRFKGCTGTFAFDLVDKDDDYVESEGDANGEPRRRRRRPLLMLSKEMEEEIEHLEQKLKIAKRKGYKDKVKKVLEKLDKLRAGIVDDDYKEEDSKPKKASKMDAGGEKQVSIESDGDATPRPISAAATASPGLVPRDLEQVMATSDGGSSSLEPSRRTSQLNIGQDGAGASSESPVVTSAGVFAPFKLKKTECSIVFALEPRTIRTVAVRFRPTSSDASAPIGDNHASRALDSAVPVAAQNESPSREIVSSVLYVHEHKNTDITKEVAFRAEVCYSHDVYLQALMEEQERHPSLPRGEPETVEPAHTMLAVNDLHADSRSPSPLTHGRSGVISGSSSPALIPQANTGAGLQSGTTPVAESDLPKIDQLPAMEPASPSLVVEVPAIDLGNVKINERKECYFTLSNRSADELPYAVTLPSDSTCSPTVADSTGTLAPQEVRRVDLQFVPISLGRQTICVTACNVRTKAEAKVSISFYVVRKAYLSFPSLPDPLATSSELDFGYCYLDTQRKFARVVPYEIENISEDVLYLSAVSNLVQQCFIFSDPATESPVTDLQVPKDGRITVYIALQPYLGASGRRGPGPTNKTPAAPVSNTSSNSAAPVSSVNDDFRTLVGGIKFLVQKKEPAISKPKDCKSAEDGAKVTEQLYLVMTYTTKFTAIIGQSVLSVSEMLIDLGSVETIGNVHKGSFHICNESSRMPLEFRIEAGDGLELDPYSGKLEGSTDPNAESHAAATDQSAAARTVDHEIPSAACTRIGFRLICTEFGLISRFIDVVNVNNAAQRFRVEVRLFADIGWLQVSSPAPAGSEADTSNTTICKLPIAQWDDVYVVLPASELTTPLNPSPISGPPIGASNAIVVERSGNNAQLADYTKEIEISNVSENVLRLTPCSSLMTEIRWAAGEVEDQPQIAEAQNMAFHICKQCGPALLVRPGERVVAQVSIPSPSFGNESDQAISLLTAGKKAALRGMLCLHDANTGMVVKSVELSASYCVSRGDIEPTVLDVGKVGHYNSWNEVKVKFTLRNLSDIPFMYALILPPSMFLEADDEGFPSGDFKQSLVPSRGSQLVEAILNPRLLDPKETGAQTLTVGVTNLYNASNTLAITVNANLTLFELRFDRLVSGELQLPQLTHPHLPTALPCDTWFTIVNTSEEDIKFEIGFAAAVDVSDFVRLDVLSRFSNSPLVGSISLTPLGSIEVRVRAYAKENSRLPASQPNSRWLTNPEGLIFGTLWIAPRQQSSEGGNEGRLEDTSRITEHIPIRGIIAEGQTFTLSEKQVNFRTYMASDSDVGSDIECEELEWETTVGPITPSKEEYSPQTIPNQRELVYIANLSTTFDLEFQVAFEYPLELPNGTSLLRAFPLSEDMKGRVAPGERFPLTFELLDASIGGVSDDIKVLVYDVNSINRQPQILYVSIIEDLSGSLQIDAEEKNQPPEDLFLQDPAMDLKGTAISARTFVDEPGSSMEEDDDLFSDTKSSTSLKEYERGPPSSSRPSIVESITSTTHTRRTAGNLALRGCKRISEPAPGGAELDGLYELDLGPQDLGASIATKKLLLENPSADRISYRLRMLTEADKSWISFSRTEGTLEGSRAAPGGGLSRDAHSISINFMTNARGVFSTYIFVDNLDNLADTKTIRVSMEIVARQNIRRTATGALSYSGNVAAGMPIEPSSNHVFDVYVHGADASVNSIVMDHLYFETEYAARSMIICNREAVPLEFTFTSSLSREDDTELMFSLSRTTAKLFRSITVEPESQARVYIRLRPSAESINGPDDGPTAALRNQFPTTLIVADEPVEKDIEIYINCRLVKDYQKIINLRAICRQPQMLLSNLEFDFRGVMRRRNLGHDATTGREEDMWSLQLLPAHAEVEIANLLTDPLDCCVMNDSMYFNVDLGTRDMEDAPSQSGGVVAAATVTPSLTKVRRHLGLSIGSQRSAAVRVTPNMDALMRHVDKLRGEKYVVEHLTVYNRRRPREKSFIVVKLSLGHMTEFQSASGSRHSYAAIESHIIKLLRDLDNHPENIQEDDVVTNNMDSSEPYFRYVYVVDQLVYFGTREHAAENYAHLAQLLFSTLFAKPVFRNRGPAVLASTPKDDSKVWPPGLSKWLYHFTYFMSFFPYRWPALEPLRELIRLLLKPPDPAVSAEASA
ncbi:hypothetical protein HDU87_006077 [Geranomyces variabilis]|uniref:Uncharacterized protein n=1 Tax=Geranomyces variabilis TaxID=109894 RepID=A0AAD5TGD6_9FUNG|nr:hypothetical protein HDU87_006077 [Geranomyces variabilis]